MHDIINRLIVHVSGTKETKKKNRLCEIEGRSYETLIVKRYRLS